MTVSNKLYQKEVKRNEVIGVEMEDKSTDTSLTCASGLDSNSVSPREGENIIHISDVITTNDQVCRVLL